MGLADRMKGAAEDLAAKAKPAAANLRDKAKPLAERMRDRADQLTDTVKESAENFAEGWHGDKADDAPPAAGQPGAAHPAETPPAPSG